MYKMTTFKHLLPQKHIHLLLFISAVVLSSITYNFSAMFYNHWAFIWVAPLPLLIYALRASAAETVCAGLLGRLCGNIFSLIVCFHSMLPFQIFLFAYMGETIVFVSLLSLFRYTALQNKHWVWSFAFASGWTAYEFIKSLNSPDGAIISIAYTQTTNLPVIQIAFITGIWGITFLLMLFPACIALSWHYRQDRLLSLKAVLIPGILFSLVILFGDWRLYMPYQSPTVKIGITAVSINKEQYSAVAKNDNPQLVSDFLQRYTQKINVLAQAGAQVILLPEKILTLNGQDNILQHLSMEARQNYVSLIVGLSNKIDEKFYNSAYIFTPDGDLVLKYDKQHLLSYFESRFIPGNTLGIVKTLTMGTWGVSICKDMDFIEPALEYSHQGINIMFVPALDFHVDGMTHARVAIMRGVEGDYAIARAAQWGLLTLSDSRGRLIAMVSTDETEEDVTLLEDLKLGTGNSIYSQWGSWFCWVCIISFVFWLIKVFVLTKKKVSI